MIADNITITHCHNGLQAISHAFTNQNPIHKPPLSHPLPQLTHIQTQTQTSTEVLYFFNITKLIDSISQQIIQLNHLTYQFTPSEITIARYVLTAMQISMLLSCRNSKDVLQLNKGKFLQGEIRDKRERLVDILREVKDKGCSLISQGNLKDQAIIFDYKNAFLKQNNFETLNEEMLKISLGYIFLNMLSNLRKALRQKQDELKSKPKVDSATIKRIKFLILIDYYVSTALNGKSFGLLKEMSLEQNHELRKKTCIYLLFEAQGIKRLFKYFNDAPSKTISQDTQLVSKILHIHKQPKIRSSVESLMPNSWSDCFTIF